MKKILFLPVFAALILLSSGCIQSGSPVESARVEKYGFSLAPPASQVWFNWQDISFGESFVEAMTEDLGSEPMLVLIKADGEEVGDISVISVMIEDNNSGFDSVTGFSAEMLESGNFKDIEFFENSEIKKLGDLEWLVIGAETEENQAFMANVAITICNGKVVAVMLMNGEKSLEENRAYFSQLVQTGKCKLQ